MNLATEAPTFYSLNKSQKRALLLRDSLRYIDVHHLDSFIDGIADPEPPAYKRLNGVLRPPLVVVTLKDTATRFDLGNVHFENDVSGANGIYRAYLTVENGSFQLRTEQALPADEANLDSVPIHVFIARTMVSMFEAKFQAICARRNQINELRQVASGMTGQPIEEFQEGETLARLNPGRDTRNASTSQSRKSKKRRPGEPIRKHSSNKRERIGLDTIPDDAKMAMFNAIPNQIKVDLFNNVLKTAFPNFNNLMMASWNVVFIYSNVSTDFPELHTAIVDLKSVLQDFEESLGVKISRKDPKLRKDFANPPPSYDGEDDVREARSPQPTPDAREQESAQDPGSAMQDDQDMEMQQQDDIEALFNETEPIPKSETPDMMPSPRMIEHHQAFNAEEEEEEEEEDIMPPPPPRVIDYHQSLDAETQEGEEGDPQYVLRRSPRPTTLLPPTSNHRPSHNLLPFTQSPSPSLTCTHLPRQTSAKLPRRHQEYRRSSSFAVQFPNMTPIDAYSAAEDEDQQPKSLAELSTTELRATYKARKAKLIQMFGGNTNVPQQYRVQMQGLMREIKEKEKMERDEMERDEMERDEEMRDAIGESRAEKVVADAMMPTFLGHSVLGEKKTGTGTGMAPVTPMAHSKKESWGTGGSGSKGERRDRN